ncbi:hypothetical protein BGZ74_001293 [Mortierella antarctica]|nr:hypothetical protein BGZ74_001293 [Mortierella antarctica]
MSQYQYPDPYHAMDSFEPSGIEPELADEEDHKMTDAILSALQASALRSSHLQDNAKDQDLDLDLGLEQELELELELGLELEQGQEQEQDQN